MNAGRFSAKKTRKRRQAAECAEQEAKAAQKRQAEAKPVELFETADSEVAARLREVYRPALISIKKVGGEIPSRRL
jgi:hypothetical protein